MFGSSLFFLLAVSSQVLAYNYLVYNPIYGYSHAKFLAKLADVVAEGGHNVTIFQSYHNVLKNTDKLTKNKKVEIINYYPDNYEELKNSDDKTFPEFWDSKLMTNLMLGTFILPKMLLREFEKEAIRVLQDKKLHEELRSKKFDAIILENFECSGLYLAHLLDLTPIATFSSVRHPAQALYGQPSNLGYVPGEGSSLYPNAGILDRLNDIYSHFFARRMFTSINNAQHEKFAAAIGGDVPHWSDLIKRSPIFMVNSNPYLDFATTNPSNIVQIGGITTPKNNKKKLEPLPEEYENILKERDSTVLVSFGSVVRSYQMPEHFKAGVIEMFKNLPEVTFIWKYEKDDDELKKRLPVNVHLKKWVPQPALLADDRLKVFMTHGGLGSTMEIAFSGKPALMVSLFGDQYTNAQMLERHGGAVAYDKYELPNAKKLTETVRKMVYSPEYKKNAEAIREVLYNQPNDPKQTFLKYIEFAVKFPNFKAQIPEISNAGFVAYYFLDAYLVLTAIFLTLAYFLSKFAIFVVRKITVLFTGKTKNE